MVLKSDKKYLVKSYIIYHVDGMLLGGVNNHKVNSLSLFVNVNGFERGNCLVCEKPSFSC